jgi:prephenate dehydrogenase
MARSHALAFFVAKALLDIHAGDDLPLTPPSFQAMARTIELVRSDAAHLFVAIERENPFAAQARQDLLDALSKVHNQLETPEENGASGVAPTTSLDIPDLGEHAPKLLQTREMIDTIDQELIRLLAQRAQLSRRAGSIKAVHGKSIRDPQRERSLLEQRRDWAREYELDPESIIDIFAAVLRFSRQLQSD